jgi:putative addiction module component (TIGR02574 family)
MTSLAVLKEAMNLKQPEKFLLVEELLKSLDTPNKELDKIWADEAQRRLDAYRNGKISGVAMEDIFQK